SRESSRGLSRPAPPSPSSSHQARKLRKSFTKKKNLATAFAAPGLNAAPADLAFPAFLLVTCPVPVRAGVSEWQLRWGWTRSKQGSSGWTSWPAGWRRKWGCGGVATKGGKGSTGERGQVHFLVQGWKKEPDTFWLYDPFWLFDGHRIFL